MARTQDRIGLERYSGLFILPLSEFANLINTSLPTRITSVKALRNYMDVFSSDFVLGQLLFFEYLHAQFAVWLFLEFNTISRVKSGK